MSVGMTLFLHVVDICKNSVYHCMCTGLIILITTKQPVIHNITFTVITVCAMPHELQHIYTGCGIKNNP